MQPARVIAYTECDAAANMATDEALLLAHAAGRMPMTLRFYGWRPAALSIGRSQDPRAVLNLEACRRLDVPFVRRPSGGGVLLHGEDLCYSLIFSFDDLGCKLTVKESYYHITAFLIRTLSRFGINASFARDSRQNSTPGPICDFCLARWEDADIIADSRKIGGNAQKRYRNAIVQHGSIPLRLNLKKVTSLLSQSKKQTSPLATSLESLAGRFVEREELATAMRASFEQCFNIPLTESCLTNSETDLINELIRNKYATDGWNYARTDISPQVQTPAGVAQ